MRLKPSEIRFSQDSINNVFDKRSRHAGKRIGETLDDLCEGRCSIESIPTITVVKEDDRWISADNRRLWVFRQLERLGKCETVSVNIGYSIPPNKRTSYNGGTSTYVRGPPGGRWHSKPTSTRPSTSQHEGTNIRCQMPSVGFSSASGHTGQAYRASEFSTRFVGIHQRRHQSDITATGRAPTVATERFSFRPSFVHRSTSLASVLTRQAYRSSTSNAIREGMHKIQCGRPQTALGVTGRAPTVATDRFSFRSTFGNRSTSQASVHTRQAYRSSTFNARREGMHKIQCGRPKTALGVTGRAPTVATDIFSFRSTFGNRSTSLASVHTSQTYRSSIFNARREGMNHYKPLKTALSATCRNPPFSTERFSNLYRNIRMRLEKGRKMGGINLPIACGIKRS